MISKVDGSLQAQTTSHKKHSSPSQLFQAMKVYTETPAEKRARRQMQAEKKRIAAARALADQQVGKSSAPTRTPPRTPPRSPVPNLSPMPSRAVLPPPVAPGFIDPPAVPSFGSPPANHISHVASNTIPNVVDERYCDKCGYLMAEDEPVTCAVCYDAVMDVKHEHDKKRSLLAAAAEVVFILLVGFVLGKLNFFFTYESTNGEEDSGNEL